MPVLAEPSTSTAINIHHAHTHSPEPEDGESSVPQTPQSEEQPDPDRALRSIIYRINNDTQEDAGVSGDMDNDADALLDEADVEDDKDVDEKKGADNGPPNATAVARELHGSKSYQAVEDSDDDMQDPGPEPEKVPKPMPARKRVAPNKKKATGKAASSPPLKKGFKGATEQGVSKKLVKKTDAKGKAVRPRVPLLKKKPVPSPAPAEPKNKPMTEEAETEQEAFEEKVSPQKGVEATKSGTSKPKKSLVRTGPKSGLSKTKVAGGEGLKANGKRAKTGGTGGQQTVVKKAKVDGSEKRSPVSKKAKSSVKVSNGESKEEVTTPNAKSAKKGSVKKKEIKTPVKKGKARKTEETPEDEDDEKAMDVADESEVEASSEVEDEEDEEMMRTPVSKGKIIGNLACSSRDEEAQELLDRAVQKLGRYNVVSFGGDCDTPLSAYILGKNTKRGWGVLRAVASGIALVTEEWLQRSMAEGAWVEMAAFRSDKFGTSPRSLMMDRGTNRLLEGMRIKVMCEGTEMGKVRKMVQVCGGRLAETRMDVVVNDTERRVDGVMNVSKKWLADSIEHGVTIDPEGYKLE